MTTQPMRAIRARHIAPLAAALLLTAACGDGDGDTKATDDTGAGGSTSAVSLADLDGTSWRAADAAAVVGTDLVDGTEITVSFDGTALSAGTGCNGIGGEVEIVDGALVADEMYGTEMGCEDARMAQEEWVRTFLASDPTIALDGDQLVLTSGDDSIALTKGAPVADKGQTGDEDGVTSNTP